MIVLPTMSESSQAQDTKGDKPFWSNVTIATIILIVIFATIQVIRIGTGGRHPNRYSLSTATSLEMAVINFDTDYATFPVTKSRVTTNTPEGVRFLNVLLGRDEKTDTPLNTRHVKYLSVREGKSTRRGLIYSKSGETIDGLFDSWGNPYTVALDVENRGHLDFTRGSIPVHLKGRRVAAYSPGADHKLGTGDDVVTW
jgi:hypothetical protein